MERKIKKEERHFNDSCQEAADSHLIPVYSKHHSSIKLLSMQQLGWSNSYMQLQCFERPGLNVQTTFADYSQTRLCRGLICVAN